jgi:hypothetical protein
MNHSGLCASAALMVVSSTFGLHSRHTRFCRGQRWHLKPRRAVAREHNLREGPRPRAKAAALLPENGCRASQLEMLVAPIADRTVRVCRPNVATATTEIGEEHAKKRVAVGRSGRSGQVGSQREPSGPSGIVRGQRNESRSVGYLEHVSWLSSASASSSLKNATGAIGGCGRSTVWLGQQMTFLPAASATNAQPAQMLPSSCDSSPKGIRIMKSSD